MKKIRDIATKPSVALQAMVDGLLEQSKRDDFVIEMSDWGSSNGTMCFGCAATCALQKLAGIDLKPVGRFSTLGERAERLAFGEMDVNYFENAINDARMGDLRTLFRFYGLTASWEDATYGFFLGDDWKNDLPKVQEVILDLQKRGL